MSSSSLLSESAYFLERWKVIKRKRKRPSEDLFKPFNVTIESGSLILFYLILTDFQAVPGKNSGFSPKKSPKPNFQFLQTTQSRYFVKNPHRVTVNFLPEFEINPRNQIENPAVLDRDPGPKRTGLNVKFMSDRQIFFNDRPKRGNLAVEDLTFDPLKLFLGTGI